MQKLENVVHEAVDARKERTHSSMKGAFFYNRCGWHSANQLHGTVGSTLCCLQQRTGKSQVSPILSWALSRDLPRHHGTPHNLRLYFPEAAARLTPHLTSLFLARLNQSPHHTFLPLSSTVCQQPAPIYSLSSSFLYLACNNLHIQQ